MAFRRDLVPYLSLPGEACAPGSDVSDYLPASPWDLSDPPANYGVPDADPLFAAGTTGEVTVLTRSLSPGVPPDQRAVIPWDPTQADPIAVLSDVPLESDDSGLICKYGGIAQGVAVPSGTPVLAPYDAYVKVFGSEERATVEMVFAGSPQYPFYVSQRITTTDGQWGDLPDTAFNVPAAAKHDPQQWPVVRRGTVLYVAGGPYQDPVWSREVYVNPVNDAPIVKDDGINVLTTWYDEWKGVPLAPQNSELCRRCETTTTFVAPPVMPHD